MQFQTIMLLFFLCGTQKQTFLKNHYIALAIQRLFIVIRCCQASKQHKNKQIMQSCHCTASIFLCCLLQLSSVLSYNSVAVVCCGELLKAVSADESHMGELIKPYLESEQQGMPPHLLYTYCQMGQSYRTSETPVCKLQSSVSCF